MSINIRHQDHSETGSLYCIIKCIVQGKQASVKNTDLHHPSCTVVMQKRKSVSPVLNVLRTILFHEVGHSFSYMSVYALVLFM